MPYENFPAALEAGCNHGGKFFRYGKLLKPTVATVATISTVATVAAVATVATVANIATERL